MEVVLLLQPWLFFLLPIFIFFPLLLFKKPSNTHTNPLPSPRKLPIIGNLHQLGSSPHRSLRTMAQKHGQLMLIHLCSVPAIIATSAEAAREIMKTHDLTFSNRAKSSVRDIITYNTRDIAFSQYGEHWRQVKSIAVLQLLSNKRVQSYRRVREEETALMVDILEKTDGSVVNVSELLVSLTNNIVCRALVGRKYGEQQWVTDLIGQFAVMLGAFSFEDYVPWLYWVDLLTNVKGRARKLAQQLDEFLEGVIEEHLEKKTKECDKSGYGQDFVDILLDVQQENADGFALERDTIKAVIMDMFSGGTDTTVTILEWALSELVKNPRVMKKLQQEVTEIAQGKSSITEDDIEKMHYLKAVIKETARLHSPIPLLVPRESTKDVKLMGYDVKAGTQVIINAWAIGRDPSSWEEPEEFKPERFLNNSIDYKGLHFELIPFGAGRRGCPGIQFAVCVNELALANLVYKFDFVMPYGGRVDDLDMSECGTLTIHRQTPLMLVANPRAR